MISDPLYCPCSTSMWNLVPTAFDRSNTILPYHTAPSMDRIRQSLALATSTSYSSISPSPSVAMPKRLLCLPCSNVWGLRPCFDIRLQVNYDSPELSTFTVTISPHFCTASSPIRRVLLSLDVLTASARQALCIFRSATMPFQGLEIFSFAIFSGALSRSPKASA